MLISSGQITFIYFTKCIKTIIQLLDLFLSTFNLCLDVISILSSKCPQIIFRQSLNSYSYFALLSVLLVVNRIYVMQVKQSNNIDQNDNYEYYDKISLEFIENLFEFVSYGKLLK